MSLPRVVPGLQPGSTIRNCLFAAVYLALLPAWPFVGAYLVGTNRNGAATAASSLPGIHPRGGPYAAIVAWLVGSALVATGYLVLLVVSPATVALSLGAFLAVGYLLALAVAGAATYGYLRSWWWLRSSDPDPIDAVRAGPVELVGTAREHELLVAPPYTETPSLVYESKRERRERDRDDDGTSYSWETKSRDSDGVPFELHGDGHSVLVEPSGAEWLLERNYRERSGRTRYSESRLEPGDDAYVAGVAIPAAETDRDLGPHRALVTEPDASLPEFLRRAKRPPTILSDRTPRSTRWRLLARAAVPLVGFLALSWPFLGDALEVLDRGAVLVG